MRRTSLPLALSIALLASCTDAPRPDETGKGEGEPCSVSSECGGALSCREGVCQGPECVASSDCTGPLPSGCTGFVCATQRCVPVCPAPDSGVFPDAGFATDAGFSSDASAPMDAQPPRDASVPDASTMDASSQDASVPPDTGPPVDSGPQNCGAARAPANGDLVINEILADPAADLTGDANADGVRDAADDEFLEIGNASSDAIDLTGVVISDATSDRHTFSSVTLECGKVIVVFGGGDDQSASWGQNWVLASSGGLSLNNPGDTVSLTSAGGSAGDLGSVTYGSEANSDQSIVRETELSAASAFIRHSLHPSAGGRLFSPGTRVDGNPF